MKNLIFHGIEFSIENLVVNPPFPLAHAMNLTCERNDYHCR